MEAGKLNRKIALQIKTTAEDADGLKEEVWTDFKTVWAQKITSGGKEFYAAQRINEETTAVFRMRYTAAVTTAMRIKDGGRYYEILPPLNDVDGRGIELLVMTKEVI